MPSQKNIQLVEKLKEKLEKAKSVVLADYKGLNVSQITELRQKIQEAGGELKVIKNTLLKLTLKHYKTNGSPASKDASDPILSALTGPTAILFSYDDEVAPIKALYQFFEENKLPKIKIGFLDQNLMEKDKVIELAQLPSREQLEGQLVGTLNGPVFGLVYCLKGSLNKLVKVLTNIKDSKN